MGLLDLIAEDKVVIIYRPRLNVVTGDANSTILMCQIIYWRKRMGRAFFKPMAVDGPTEAEKSFSSELAFSKKEIERASKNLSDRGLIVTWYQRLEHRTWWDLAANLEEKIRECYSDELSNCNYSKSPKVTSGSAKRSLREVPKGHMDISKITSEITNPPPPTPPVTEEEEKKLPYPFQALLPAQLQEAKKLCKLNSLNLQQQCQALKGLAKDNPANYLLTVLRRGGFAGAAEVAEKAREAQARNTEKKAADAARRQAEEVEEKRAVEKRDWHKEQARAVYLGLQAAAQGGQQ